MRIPDDKKVGYLLVSSIIFNLIFFGYSIRNFIGNTNNIKPNSSSNLKKSIKHQQETLHILLVETKYSLTYQTIQMK